MAQRSDLVATKKTEKKREASYSKGAFLRSKVFRYQMDLIDAILEDDKTYTVKEVEDLLQKELKRKVIH